MTTTEWSASGGGRERVGFARRHGGGGPRAAAAGDAKSATAGADVEAWGAVGSGTGGDAEVAARGDGAPGELPAPNTQGRREATRGVVRGGRGWKEQ
jgi:hypothetical protein